MDQNFMIMYNEIVVSNLLKEEYKIRLSLSFPLYLQWYATEVIN